MSGERAVLYVCVRRPGERGSDAEERALDEGRSFAAARGLSLVSEITDPYGEPDPDRREGWRLVRGLAADGEIDVVVTRWPTCIAPDLLQDRRHEELNRLGSYAVRVLYSWAQAVPAEVSRL